MSSGQREREDFEAIVEKHSRFVYNVALKITRNPHDAEEVMQEAFLSAFRSYDSFKGESQVTTWLYRITVNAALMRLRKEKKGAYLTQIAYDDVDIPHWEDGPEQAAIKAELGEKLEQGIGRLPPELRLPVVLRDVQGFSNEEAAGMLGITLAAFKARLHRGRLLLRKHLEGYLKSR